MLGYGSGAFTSTRISQIPMGRAGRPDEVADVIAILISDGSRYMTGQAVNVTGGSVTW